MCQIPGMRGILDSIDEEYAEIMPIDEWRVSVKAGHYNDMDGSGVWVKDGKYLTGKLWDDVFSEPPPEATHVAWFGK